VLDPAGELHEYMLSEILDRLQLPGGCDTLTEKLLQTVVRRERPN
jgi:hypothetical protein